MPVSGRLQAKRVWLRRSLPLSFQSEHACAASQPPLQAPMARTTRTARRSRPRPGRPCCTPSRVRAHIRGSTPIPGRDGFQSSGQRACLAEPPGVPPCNFSAALAPLPSCPASHRYARHPPLQAWSTSLAACPSWWTKTRTPCTSSSPRCCSCSTGGANGRGVGGEVCRAETRRAADWASAHLSSQTEHCPRT